MKFTKIGVTGLFIICCSLIPLLAQPNIIQVNDAGQYTSIDTRVSVLEHPNIETMTMEDVYKVDSLFKPNAFQTANVGDWTGQTSWFKIELENKPKRNFSYPCCPLLRILLRFIQKSTTVGMSCKQGD